MFRMFDKNKAAILLALVAMGKTLIENYWIFSLPFNEDNSPANDAIKKILYMAGELFTAATMGAGLGMTLDYARAIYNRGMPEEQPIKTQTANYNAL